MPLEADADALLNRAASAGEVPGVIAAVTDRQGEFYANAFGRRVLGGAAMTVDSVVWIASMTKALTGAVAMQLVERGKLALDQPAAEIVPALAKAAVQEGFDASGQPRTRPPRRPITLRNLLTHSAGFSYEFWNAEIGRYQQVKGVPGIITCENAALTTPLIADPDTRWEYGINIDWAGKMVEAASGETLSAFMHRNLFEPLGMTDSTFKITPSMRTRLAKIHQRDAMGALAPIDLEIPQTPEFEMGGGGVYSTAGDYLKFVRMILNRGRNGSRQVLKPETVDLMSRNNMGKLRVTPMKSVLPDSSLDIDLFPGITKTWGLSFMINEAKAPTGRSAGSLFWCGIANTYFWIDPAKGIGGVFFTQILPLADRKAFPLFEAFETCVYRARG
jgi:CubicO group peptidase (beta-lactamase class C family)